MFNFHDCRFFLTSFIAFLTIIISTPILAVGSNTSSPLPPTPTPTPVITNTPNLNNVGDGGCVEQYDDRFNALNNDIFVADSTGLATSAAALVAQSVAVGTQAAAATADAAAFTAMSAGLATTTLYGLAPAPTAGGVPGSIAASAAAGTLAASSGTDAAALGAEIAGLVADGVGVASEIAATVITKTSNDLSVYVDTLPECNTEFTGTVKVSNGGIDVTGDSVINGNAGVNGDLDVTGTVGVSKLAATQGISAFDGGIHIGDPNGTTYSSGITLGGGALSGAGTGGAQAFTGHVDAIAIGNNATAMMSGSVALGLDASANEVDAIAVGNAAVANGVMDVVVGANNNTAAGGKNTVVGNEIDIIGDASTDNTVLGSGHQVTGSGNFVGGDPITVVGSNNVATGSNGTVTGDSNVAIGDTVNVTGDRNVTIGDNATATADDTTVVGSNARAEADGSAAYGQGAVATLDQQQVFGTLANTYSTPGITSELSRSRQSGPLELVSSDIGGNLATDGGLVFESLSKHQAGIAIAMAMANPSLNTEEKFGIAINWGNFQSTQAIAASVMGVVNENVFGGGERLSLTGGLGISINQPTFAGQQSGRVGGGRIGAQLTW